MSLDFRYLILEFGFWVLGRHALTHLAMHNFHCMNMSPFVKYRTSRAHKGPQEAQKFQQVQSPIFAEVVPQKKYLSKSFAFNCGAYEINSRKIKMIIYLKIYDALNFGNWAIKIIDEKNN